MSESEQEKPLPPVPHPDLIANLILSHKSVMQLSQHQISVLRRQLKYSCEYHGVPYFDPSVKPRAKKEV